MKIKDLKKLLESASDDTEIKVDNGEIVIAEPKDITERIQTFEDACEWCNENGKAYLVTQYETINEDLKYSCATKDLISYLKLRIIATALNEGWESTFAEGEARYNIAYNVADDMVDYGSEDVWVVTSYRMLFKSRYLANYAAKRFRDIFADFAIRNGGKK